MEENWEPFETRETAEGLSIWLCGTQDGLGILDPDDTAKISEAMHRGWGIHIENAVLNGDVDPRRFGRFDVTGSIVIQNSCIKGTLFFDVLTFKQTVDFTGTNFRKAIFREAVFCMRPIFNKTKFERSETAHFGGVRFDKGVDFVRVKFSGNAYFRKTIFGEEADFVHAKFEKEADFIRAEFIKRAAFILTCFAEADFSEARFKDEVVFRDSMFEKSAIFDMTKMKYPANFKNVCLFENSVPRGFWNHILWPVIHGLTWLLSIGRLRVPKATVTNIRDINTNTIMDGASNPRLKRYIDDEQWIQSWRANPKGRWWREPVFRLWELTSHCGRSIGLWTSLSAIIATVFAFIYYGRFGCGSIVFDVDQLSGFQPDFWDYLYYSVVTFTTLGFGDIVPLTKPARLAVGLEVVLGYVMLGGLISIFASKFARRS